MAEQGQNLEASQHWEQAMQSMKRQEDKTPSCYIW